jgi:hypothetical protein
MLGRCQVRNRMSLICSPLEYLQQRVQKNSANSAAITRRPCNACVVGTRRGLVELRRIASKSRMIPDQILASRGGTSNHSPLTRKVVKTFMCQNLLVARKIACAVSAQRSLDRGN